MPKIEKIGGKYIIKLKDNKVDIVTANKNNLKLFEKALKGLQFRQGNKELKSFKLYETGIEDSDDTTIEIIKRDYSPIHKGNDDSIQVKTGCYIGSYVSSNSVQILIQPRFGSAFFGHMLSYASDLYLPEEGHSYFSEGHDVEAYWLLALLWKAAMEHALTANHIPHSYVQVQSNLPVLKGRLLINHHLAHNLVNKHLMFCEYFQFTPDNIINRAIVHAYDILCKKNLENILGDAHTHVNHLLALGVQDAKVDTKEIDQIVYTPMTESYQLLMNLCRILIDQDMASMHGEEMAAPSFFIDVSKVWENYIFKLIERELSGYNIENPNFLPPQYFLLEGDNNRLIIPDMILRDDKGKIVAILDAKYKFYEKLGKSSKDGRAVSREDFYQMNSYLLHFLPKEEKDPDLKGIFISPYPIPIDEVIKDKKSLEVIGEEIDKILKGQRNEEMSSFTEQKKITIGLLCLPVLEKSDENNYYSKKEITDFILSKQKKMEQAFIEKLKGYLHSHFL